MAIPFKQIPANLLVPGQYQEVDNSLAGAQGDIKKALIIGYGTGAGTATAAKKPVNVLTAQKARDLCGAGSPAAIMAEAFLARNTVEELWALPVAEPEAGTAWKQKFTVAAPSAQAGSITVTINGVEYSAAVQAAASAQAIAAALVARINAETSLPVSAEIDGSTAEILWITATAKGAWGNDNTVTVVSEAEGVSVTDGGITAGAGVTALAPYFAGLGETRYNFIASGFQDAANIGASADELDSRYSAGRQIGGRMYLALTGELGAKTEAGTMLNAADGVNSPHIVLVPRSGNPALPCEWAAAWCAAACRILADDPAANTYDTEVSGLAASVEFTAEERQKMLEAGIATYRLAASGNVLIERLVTSYTENTDGGRDTSYLDAQVVETVDAVRTHINAEAKKRFKDWKLAGTGENFGSGAKVMTPGVFRGFLAELYGEVFLKEKQWCQDFDSYIKSIAVEVKAGSKTRLEYSHQPVLIGQFYIGAGLLQFK
jgi:phage tail sheath gpL-like